MTLEGKDASDDDIRMKFEMPSLRPIAEKIRQDAAEKRLKDEANNEEDDEDYRKRPAKLVRFALNQKTKEDDNLEEEAASLRKKCLKSQEEFMEDFFKILGKFFEAAFTIVVKRRRLCPALAFDTVKVLGIDVPRFLHPASLEYVEEVSKKLLLFINRNVTEGCVIHIMIEKNKTLHVVQRFVFRVVGAINFVKMQKNETQDLDLDLEEVERQCAHSLLDILNCDSIRPMQCPQFSRWSISIGMKPEFMRGIDDEYFKELWNHDPSGGYFPWKKRQKEPSQHWPSSIL
ncbi:DNA polymerase zeta processivity subunit [Orchesella cincta]|uniref:DNA polymerase zeta processivity subunit n=1 Tax=Orchesella cincta TaxID=48709 RepID=A0A1D2MP03_ORCCI|nr:DNA polymerase zeta processivity subunit [Orchesella cincta]